MLTRMKSAVPAALALALSFVLLPQVADAQEGEQAAEEQCTVEVSPQRIASGQPAISVTARLSQSIGAVESLDAKDGGLALASSEEIGRTQMARTEEEPPEPVQMSSSGTEATVWLNTQDVGAGEHSFVLKGENGECSGHIEVAEVEMPEEPEGR